MIQSRYKSKTLELSFRAPSSEDPHSGHIAKDENSRLTYQRGMTVRRWHAEHSYAAEFRSRSYNER